MARHEAERAEVLRALPVELGRRLDALADAEREVREIVRDLVLGGYSWADVGRMLGVSRQGARQRFGGEVDAWKREHGDALPWDVWPAEDDDALRAEVRAVLGESEW